MKNKNVFLLIFQSMNDVWVSVKRVLKFVIPVTLGSIVFNIPKFFEAGVIYTNLSSNITVADLEVKSIRKDPNYIKYYNITARVLVNGIIPFLLLIYFNIMIYRDVKVNTYVFMYLYTFQNLKFDPKEIPTRPTYMFSQNRIFIGFKPVVIFWWNKLLRLHFPTRTFKMSIENYNNWIFQKNPIIAKAKIAEQNSDNCKNKQNGVKYHVKSFEKL